VCSFSYQSPFKQDAIFSWHCYGHLTANDHTHNILLTMLLIPDCQWSYTQHSLDNVTDTWLPMIIYTQHSLDNVTDTWLPMITYNILSTMLLIPDCQWSYTQHSLDNVTDNWLPMIIHTTFSRQCYWYLTANDQTHNILSKMLIMASHCQWSHTQHLLHIVIDYSLTSHCQSKQLHHERALCSI